MTGNYQSKGKGLSVASWNPGQAAAEVPLATPNEVLTREET